MERAHIHLDVVIALFAAGLLGGGGAACSVPFDFEHEGRFAIPLGMVGGCSGTENGSIPSSGEPDAEGNLTTWQHTRTGDLCALGATWSGPLMNMGDVRDLAEEQMLDEGFDPEDVRVEIVSFDPAVRLVRFTNDDEPLDLPEGFLLGYRGTLDVASVEDVMAFSFDPPGDPEHPEVEVNTPDELIGEVNEAWRERAVLPGRATASVEVSMDGAAAVGAARMPVMAITFTIRGEGEASP